MKTLNKAVITRWNDQLLTALVSDREVLQLSLEDESERSILNNIYIGKVKNIVKNINAAFVDIGDGRMAYYSLTENRIHHYTGAHPGAKLCAGDEIIVQVARDAVKTKDPVLTSQLNFTGKYCVLTVGKNIIGFSAKIADEAWKQELKPLLEEKKEEDFGIIIRTNAREAETSMILEELNTLKALYRKIMELGTYRTCYSLLYEAVPSCVSSIRDTYAGYMEEIITDDPEVHQLLEQYLKESQPEDLGKLRLYQDSMVDLIKLYRIETAMEEALHKKVWLKSGGYLVIETTEALSVVDVNTGKYAGKKNLRDTIMKINLEAAEETARQLRLRNLSGIIIIDFIDMELEEDQKLLLSKLSEWCRKDPVKTTVVDITKLNLVEVTRKKLRRPLHEQVGKRR